MFINAVWQEDVPGLMELVEQAKHSLHVQNGRESGGIGAAFRIIRARSKTKERTMIDRKKKFSKEKKRGSRVT